jgi:hypothetical protein
MLQCRSHPHLYPAHTVQFDRALAERGCTADPGYPGTTESNAKDPKIMLQALALGMSYEKVSMISGVINVKQGYHEP